jgi:glucarate dehydratase
MKIVGLDAFEVAIPFSAPILSSFGVSYPARIRTFIRVHTDAGLTGIGEAGPSAVHPYPRGSQLRRFQESVQAAVVGENPADHRWIARKLYHASEATAVELACWDIIGKSAGLPLYRLLGGQGEVASVALSGYCFFRLPDREGAGAVTLDTMVEHCRSLRESFGFEVLKVKLGAHQPGEELDTLRKVREALGPEVGLRVDPNGSWSLPTAVRALARLRDLDLEYLEEPTRVLGKGDHTVDTGSLRRLRGASTVPIAADHCYRADLLAQIIRDEAADVVLADLFGCGGISDTLHYCRTAATFGLGVALHSGTELGVGQVAKMHVQAALPQEVRFASDAIYPEYVDDVLEGGKLAIEGGRMRMPDAPGLGVELSDDKLAQWELTDERKRELDAYWVDLKKQLGVTYPHADLLMRHY